METLGSANPCMATLGARFGDPLGPNLELLTKSTPKMNPKSSKCLPKVIKMTSQSRQNVNKNDMNTIICKAKTKICEEIKRKVGGTREALRSAAPAKGQRRVWLSLLV